MGLNGTETILIHSSMKAIGDVEGGAETVLDAWMERFNQSVYEAGRCCALPAPDPQHGGLW